MRNRIRSRSLSSSAGSGYALTGRVELNEVAAGTGITLAVASLVLVVAEGGFAGVDDVDAVDDVDSVDEVDGVDDVDDEAAWEDGKSAEVEELAEEEAESSELEGGVVTDCDSLEMGSLASVHA